MEARPLNWAHVMTNIQHTAKIWMSMSGICPMTETWWYVLSLVNKMMFLQSVRETGIHRTQKKNCLVLPAGMKPVTFRLLAQMLWH